LKEEVITNLESFDRSVIVCYELVIKKLKKLMCGNRILAYALRPNYQNVSAWLGLVIAAQNRSFEAKRRF